MNKTNQPEELEILLEGITEPKARERIIAAYHTFAQSGPESFPIQFAILGAAIAARVDRSLASCREVVGQTGQLQLDPEDMSRRITEELPALRDLKQLSEQLKRSVSNSKQGRGAGYASLVILVLINTASLAWLIMR